MSAYNWPLMKNSISLLDRAKLAKFVLTSDKFTQGKRLKSLKKNGQGGWVVVTLCL